MKYLFLFIFLFAGSLSIQAQDIYGYWEGTIREAGKDYKLEVHIEKGSRKDPTVLHCRSCRKVKGLIVDERESEKIIDFYGIINRDQSVNLVDKKLVIKEDFEGETRSRYQFVIEIQNGLPVLVGYWQEYNSRGSKVKQGKFYLTRAKPIAAKV